MASQTPGPTPDPNLTPVEDAETRPAEGGIPSGRLVIVGKITAPRGLKGEVQVAVISDSPGRFSSGGTLYLQGHPHRILRSYPLPKGKVGLRLEAIDTRAQAETLRNSYLEVPEELVPSLPEGKYYHFQILDLAVHTSQGAYLGRINDILSTRGNDVYVVEQEGQDLLIPAVDDVILEVDLETKTMTVELPEGLA